MQSTPDTQVLLLSEQGSLNAAVQTIGTGDTVLVVDQVAVVSQDLTIDENTMLFFVKNGRIRVDSGAVLTINGTIAEETGSHQIFGGVGGFAGSFFENRTGNPDWFISEGSTDHTLGLQRAYNFFESIRFSRDYNVSLIDFKGHDKSVDFNGYRLVGSRNTAGGAVAKISGYNLTFSDMAVDGNFNSNYTTAVSFRADHAPDYVAHDNTINGLKIYNAVYGLVVGEHPDNGVSTSSQSMTNNRVFNLHIYDTQSQVTMNQLGSDLCILSGITAVHNANWNASPNPGLVNWDESYAVRTMAGLLSAENFQIGGFVATTGHVAVFEAPFVGDGLILESSAPMLIDSDVALNFNLNGYYGTTSRDLFDVADNSTGSLMLNGIHAYRILSFANGEAVGGPAEASVACVVDTRRAPGFDVTFKNCLFKEWGFNSGKTEQTYFRGPNVICENLAVVNTFPEESVLLNTTNANILSGGNFTLDGGGLPAAKVSDLSWYSGWRVSSVSHGSGYGFFGVPAAVWLDNPEGADTTSGEISYLRLEGGSEQGAVVSLYGTNGIPVESGRFYAVAAVMRNHEASAGQLTDVEILQYTSNGDRIADADMMVFQPEGSTEFERVRSKFITDSEAVFVAFRITTRAGMKFDITGLSIQEAF
jgi:hypothetical protein